MNLNDLIINTALLGTASKDLPVSDVPEELQGSFRELKEKAQDTEAAFYRMAALGLAYSRAGLEATQPDGLAATTEAAKEDIPYFSREAGELLLALVSNRNRRLLIYAYRLAASRGKLIRPNYLQALLSNAFDRNNPLRNKEQRCLSQLTGNRGRWLMPLMGLPAWGAKETITWETASHEERKALLTETRRENPDAGLDLLRTELKNESAPHREELLQCLREQLNGNDEAFLQEILATDRSSNVKNRARRLLCGLPGSQQVRYYWELLKGKLRYNMLLGWSYDKIEFTPEMKTMGLVEVSHIKNERDDRFLLRQLAERVPLAFWRELYGCEPEKAARKLAKNPPFQDLFDFWSPIKTFNDSLWAYNTLKERTDERGLRNLLGLVPPALREELSLKEGDKERYFPGEWFNMDGEPWGIKFSTHIFYRLLGRNYYLPKEELERIAVYFPDGIRPLIEKRRASIDKQESIAYQTCRQLLDYMEVKRLIGKAFNE